MKFSESNQWMYIYNNSLFNKIQFKMAATAKQLQQTQIKGYNDQLCIYSTELKLWVMVAEADPQLIW